MWEQNRVASCLCIRWRYIFNVLAPEFPPSKGSNAPNCVRVNCSNDLILHRYRLRLMSSDTQLLRRVLLFVNQFGKAKDFASYSVVFVSFSFVPNLLLVSAVTTGKTHQVLSNLNVSRFPGPIVWAPELTISLFLLFTKLLPPLGPIFLWSWKVLCIVPHCAQFSCTAVRHEVCVPRLFDAWNFSITDFLVLLQRMDGMITWVMLRLGISC